MDNEAAHGLSTAAVRRMARDAATAYLAQDWTRPGDSAWTRATLAQRMLLYLRPTALGHAHAALLRPHEMTFVQTFEAAVTKAAEREAARVQR